ncbi:MAG TPA: hypothetical protein VGM90_10605 [Kofleriaceae bacterium]|jgi:hypothetical protein
MPRKVAFVLLALWAGVGIVVGGVMMLRHAAFRVPDRSNAALRAGVATLFPGPSTWAAVHVFYRSCTCSKKTIEHLLSRGAEPGVDEVVVVADDTASAGPEDAALRARGYRVVVMRPADLRTRVGVEAAPVLIVRAPDGALAYVGGYSRAKQDGHFADVAIIADARQSRSIDTLPVFGCATSARLAAAVDPLGLERRASEP